MDQKQRGNPSEAEGFMDGIKGQKDEMMPGFNRDSLQTKTFQAGWLYFAAGGVGLTAALSTVSNPWARSHISSRLGH